MIDELDDKFKISNKNKNSQENSYLSDEFYKNSIHREYGLYFVLALSLFSKIIIHPLDRKEFDENYYFLSGLPILKRTFFEMYFIVVLGFLIHLIYYALNENLILEKLKLSEKISIILSKVKFLTFFNSLLQYTTFMIIYHNLVIPFNNLNKFKISGHFLINSFVIRLFFNLIDYLANLEKSIITQKSFYIIQILVKFMIIHTYYTLFFTGYIYHSFFESFLGLAIGHILYTIINSFEIDNLIILLLFPKFIRRDSEKDLLK